jgi:hypothetical protein
MRVYFWLCSLFGGTLPSLAMHFSTPYIRVAFDILRLLSVRGGIITQESAMKSKKVRGRGEWFLRTSIPW